MSSKRMISRRRVQSVVEAGAEMQRIKFVLLLIILGVLITTAVMPVLAHGGGLIYVAGEEAGDYRVTVWVAPNEVEAGKTLHFTVAVVESENNDMILDAEVDMEVFAADYGELMLSGPATTEQSVNKLFYEADFPESPDAGTYTVVTTVNGRYGTGDVSFDFEIIPAKTTINWLFIGIGGLVLVAGVSLFLSRRSSV
jgi:hypothetical protein